MKVVHIVDKASPVVCPHTGPYLHQSEEDFSVIILGCGCPQTVLGRGFPATMVQCQGKFFLVDVGDGTVRQLAEGGFHCGKIENVLFTHHHADHDAGYPYFLINSWMNDRMRLNLVGPPKTKSFHDAIVEHYKEDIQYRSTSHPEKLAGMYSANIREIEDKADFELDGVHITTAKMIHTAHTIAYRFAFDGKVIVVSGDTSYTPALVELAKDADILVMDAGRLPDTGFISASRPYAEGTPSPGRFGPTGSAIRVNPPHPCEGEVGRIAQESGVKTLVLTHYIPTMVDEAAAEAEIRESGYTGNIVFSCDLMEVLP